MNAEFVSFQSLIRSDLYEILIDPTVVKDTREILENQECLDRAIPELYQIGQPLDLGSGTMLEFLVTRLRGGSGNAIGRFNFLDRFATMDGVPLIDGFGARKVLQLTHDLRGPPLQFCSNAAHEIQHLISFDYKVLRKIPAAERGELTSMRKHRVFPERDGLNEGYSHLIEELSLAPQQVSQHLLRFLENPSGTSLALEVSFNKGIGNSKTRGMNLALVYFALARAGGSLSLSDARTLRFLQQTITSPETGIPNLAKAAGLEPMEFLATFLRELAVSLYSEPRALSFFPHAVQEEDGVTRGISFLNRGTRFEDFRTASPHSFHPISTRIPLLSRIDSIQLEPETLAQFRWIVPPETLPNNPVSSISVRGGATDFLVVLTRVR